MTTTEIVLIQHTDLKPFIAFAFPTDGIPVILDMSTSSIPYGKLKLAEVEGRAIPADGFDRVYFPGEIEGICRKKRQREGIPVEPGLCLELTRLGERFGVAPVGVEPVTYGRADIETDSPLDVRDALSNVPQISNFNTDADRSTSNRFRTAGYQPIIHNLGIYSTLTLFNGHRMADVGGEAVFAGVSMDSN